MSEKNAHKFLLRIREQHDRLERVENVLVPGMPDVSGCFSGNDFWIETKQPTEPKRVFTPLFGSNHKLSDDQRNWFLMHRNAGGAGIVYIQTDQMQRMFIGGEHADVINELPLLRLKELAFWKGDKATARSSIIAYCLKYRIKVVSKVELIIR